jgi:crotonobetainyl-CoA:carnitine CoA-transferase CaiB-like acyl-CoA transferase
MTVTGPLSDVLVIDLTRALSGPYCTMVLADLGADVIKVEPPAGDGTRAHGPFPTDDESHAYGGYFQSVNRNKRGIMLDLRSDDGRATLRRLIEQADVVVENFRPGVMEAMGLGYESLAHTNPALVYGALRGFGDPRTGLSPYAHRPAFDVVAQAMGGLLQITGESGHPTKTGPGVGDIFPAVLLATGILAALTAARTTGRGRFVDVSMYDAIVALCERSAYLYSYAGRVATGEGNDHPLLCPFGVYAARDGWVTIAAPRDHQWRRLWEIAGRPGPAHDPRFATNAGRVEHRSQVREAIESWTTTMTPDQIVAALDGQVPCGPLNTAADVAADPHIAARNMLVPLEHPGSATTVTVAGTPIKFAGTTPGAFRRAPLLGEHTDEVLTEFDQPTGRSRPGLRKESPDATSAQ